MSEDINIESIRRQIRSFLSGDAGRYYMKHLEDSRDDAWKRFINLETDKKTSKSAYNASANYKAYQEEIDWLSLHGITAK